MIGLTIVAFGTSMPELAVSVTAALQGSNEIAVGNVVGSNIFNLLVVAGASACLYPLICDRVLLKRDWPLSAVAAILLGIFLLGDQTISRLEALVLLVIFAVVLFLQLKGAKQEENIHPEERSMGRLPELVTSVVAARKGENDIAMGNVIGSNLFNILCILGVSALLHPIHVEVTALYDTAFLVVVTVVYWLICRRRSPDRLIGTAMILTDIGYMAYIILR